MPILNVEEPYAISADFAPLAWQEIDEEVALIGDCHLADSPRAAVAA